MFFGVPRMLWSILPVGVEPLTFGAPPPLGPELLLLLLLLLPQAASTPVAATADPAPMKRRRVSGETLADEVVSSVSGTPGSF
jgi:hypothetical protein